MLLVLTLHVYQHVTTESWRGDIKTTYHRHRDYEAAERCIVSVSQERR
jgi:hypothetical protein